MTDKTKLRHMIDGLPREALQELLDNYRIDRSDQTLRICLFEAYEDGEVTAEEIKAAWADKTWKGIEQ